MKSRFIIFLGFMSLIGCIVLYMILTSNQNPSADHGTGHKSSISVWIYSDALASYFHDFQQKNPGVNIQLRVFRSSTQLYDELLTAISANNTPQLAEIRSFYGLAQLADTGALVPFGDSQNPGWDTMVPAFVSVFEYASKRWAVPVGGSVPVIYYNQNLFRLADAQEEMTDWDAVVRAGRKLTKDTDNDGKTDIWGLVADPNMAWYHQNMAYDYSKNKMTWEKISRSYRYWHEILAVNKSMPPLEHQMAASQFIYGKSGMFLSSSSKRTTLEKYIGGKYAFGAIPFPGIGGQQEIIPDVSGLALLDGDHNQLVLAWKVIEYMLSDEVQSTLWRESALIPVQLDVVQQLRSNQNLQVREQFMLQMVDRLAVIQAQPTDTAIWMQHNEMQEWLEQSPNLSLEQLFDKLQSVTW